MCDYIELKCEGLSVSIKVGSNLQQYRSIISLFFARFNDSRYFSDLDLTYLVILKMRETTFGFSYQEVREKEG